MENMKITCLVDNAVKPVSSLWGEHGLSFFIESDQHGMLFDTGASGTVLLHNLEQAGIPPENIDALALSHSHPDHTGGLPALLSQREGIPIYAHPDLFRPRFSRQGGEMRPKWLRMSPDELKQMAELHLDASPQQILPGIWATGEITERNEPEGRSPHHFVRSGEGWAPDPYRDDTALVLETKKGLFVLCGCCHAGLLNTLDHVRRQFGRDPVGVAGGTHLISASKEQIDRTAARLQDMGSPILYLNHCTGPRAFVALSQAFGDRVTDCPAGTTIPC
jgi:7,8-dihydropterin-6-yl-methyl-4-(beta-D-ribofuranosyl)aminobenzene 5'-phosphate synthase